MKWNYDDSIRDLFSQGPHRDILIVPHATYVTPVPGGPPEITSKVPQFEWRGVPVYDEKEKKFVMMQKPFPKKDLITGEVLREDVEWVITNDDIVKEKFKYSHSLNSESNLTFSSCNAAMVQFTIRNKKQYIQELDEQGEPTGNYYWEQEVPNLQNYEFVEKDPNGNSRKIIGELGGNACIKVYTYINGDSSTLMYLGMFNVDEDKAVDNGYNRQITAYDFMAFFRDCDIFYWYKHLWTGINKLDNDFEDYTSDDEEKEKKKPDDYDAEVNWVRKPAKDLYPDRDGRWTIGEALRDLFENFAAYDMITYDEEEVEVEDPDTHEKKKIKKTVAKLGNTVTNPNSYGRNYEEGNGYTGLGMPVMLDPDLFNKDKSYNIPTEPGADQYECYGYMDALDIEFYQDPNIMKQESLSMGKFLEDIGLLAGRYPYIRTDHLQDDDWFDPATKTGNQNRYNNYEKCILTFKPLPSSKDDSKLPTEQMLDNTEISKGFSHESYTVDDIEIVKINFQDKSKIEYSRLTASQRKDKKTGNVQTFTFSDNLFVSYLVEKSDNEEIKKKLENYKALRNKIFGKENKKGNMSSTALFAQGYYNMKYRSYVPYELTTYADPVRDVGDRIKITYTDVITGEHVSFFSYILEREMNGIQKCLDTYKAQGDGLNPVFSNYQTGSKYQSGSSYAASSFGYNAVYSGTGAGGSSGSGALGITPSDLVQYWRNFGIRLLDEPSDCQAKFVKGASTETGQYVEAKNHNGSWDGVQPTEGDTDTHGLMWHNSSDIVSEWLDVTKEEPYDMAGPYGANPNISSIYYLYTLNGEWTEHDLNSVFTYDYSGWSYDHETHNSEYIAKTNFLIDIQPYDLKPGDTTNKIYFNGEEIEVQINDAIAFKDNPGREYSNLIGAWIRWDGDCDFDDYLNGLSNFEVTDTDQYGQSHKYRIAHYISPGVWSILPDPNHIHEGRVLFYDTSGTTNYPVGGSSESYSNGPVCPRYTITPIIKPGDTTTDIKINNIPVNVYNGFYIESDIWRNTWTTNLQKLDEWWDETHQELYNAVYMYPGNWLKYNGDINDFNENIEINTKKYVSLKWSDPQDITDWKPTPATWEGTVIVRKENSAPLHRWDGEKVIRTTTRDKYKTKAYKDEDIRANKVYYYGFFPYYTKIADPDHPIRFYTFTKSIRVETGVITYAPVIESITVDGDNATITYAIVAPADTIYTSIKLYGRIGETPKCDDTDDIVEDIDRNETSIVISDLSYDTEYYFVIQCIDMNEAETNSNVIGCNTENPVPPDLRPYIQKLSQTTCSSNDDCPLTWYGHWGGGSSGCSIDSNYTWITVASDFNAWTSYSEFYIMNIGTIYVTDDNGNISVLYILENAPDNVVTITYKDMYGRYTTYSGNYIYYIFMSGLNLYMTDSLTNSHTIPSFTSTFNSMLSCMQYLAQHFRHVNLVVNGVDWLRI